MSEANMFKEKKRHMNTTQSICVYIYIGEKTRQGVTVHF